MIGYVTVGTNDLEQAILFYDEVLATIGINSLSAVHHLDGCFRPKAERHQITIS